MLQHQAWKVPREGVTSLQSPMSPSPHLRFLSCTKQDSAAAGPAWSRARGAEVCRAALPRGCKAGSSALHKMRMLAFGAFHFPEVSAVFSFNHMSVESLYFPSDQMLVDFTEEILIFK